MSSSRTLKTVAIDLMWMDPHTMEYIHTEELEYLESGTGPSDESPDRPTHYVATALAEPEEDPSVVDIVLPSPNSTLYTAENWLFRNMEWPDSGFSGQQGGPAEKASPSTAASPAAAAAPSAGTSAPLPSSTSGRKDAAPSAAAQEGPGQSATPAAAVSSGNTQESSENQTGRGRLAQMRHRFTQWVGLARHSDRRE